MITFAAKVSFYTSDGKAANPSFYDRANAKRLTGIGDRWYVLAVERSA